MVVAIELVLTRFLGCLDLWIGSWKFVKPYLNCKSDIQICFLTDVLIVFMGGGDAGMTHFALISI